RARERRRRAARVVSGVLYRLSAVGDAPGRARHGARDPANRRPPMVPQGRDPRRAGHLQGRHGRHRARAQRRTPAGAWQRRPDGGAASQYRGRAGQWRHTRRGAAHSARRDRTDRRCPIHGGIPSACGRESPRTFLERRAMRAAVVALGDLGRAARMCYHARGLASNDVEVDLVGLEGTPLSQVITGDGRITVHRIAASYLRYRRGLTGFGYSLAALVDAWRLSIRLWRTLRALPAPTLVIVQNPPQFPTLAVTW